nr:nonribosomal peptide synthetase dtxs1 [Quercus suber]
MIQGPTIAREYLAQPEGTAASFITSLPVWATTADRECYGRFYKSGDLARYNPDGTIEFVSRRDTQVKIRGFRVELADVEHYVRASSEGAPQVVVDMLEADSRRGGPSLVAFLCFAATSRVKADDVAESDILLALDDSASHQISRNAPTWFMTSITLTFGLRAKSFYVQLQNNLITSEILKKGGYVLSRSVDLFPKTYSPSSDAIGKVIIMTRPLLKTRRQCRCSKAVAADPYQQRALTVCPHGSSLCSFRVKILNINVPVALIDIHGVDSARNKVSFRRDSIGEDPNQNTSPSFPDSSAKATRLTVAPGPAAHAGHISRRRTGGRQEVCRGVYSKRTFAAQLVSRVLDVEIVTNSSNSIVCCMSSAFSVLSAFAPTSWTSVGSYSTRLAQLQKAADMVVCMRSCETSGSRTCLRTIGATTGAHHRNGDDHGITTGRTAGGDMRK